MWPGTPPRRRRRRWGARAGPCWRGCTAAGARWAIRSSRRARPDRRLLQGLAGAAALAVGLAVTLVVLLLPGGPAVVPAAVAAVARYAQAVPPPARDQHPGARVAPVEVGRPV